MRFSAVFLTALLFTGAVDARSYKEQFPGRATVPDAGIQSFLERLDYRSGRIELSGGFATLDVPVGYYYLGPADAARVLTDAWGNPPGQEPSMGMLFPANFTPFDHNAWAVEILWEDIGYVSDEEAESYDYDELLEVMKRDTVEQNLWRTQNGYDTIELVRWAVRPRYRRDNRTLYWAKELLFGGAGNPAETVLNYEIRMLGRKGVLMLNFIADISALAEIERKLPQVLTMATFKEGARYSDFDPSVDQVAAVGIGGLIAGKVLTKAGLLAAALVLLKKFWFVALLPLLWIWRMLTRTRD